MLKIGCAEQKLDVPLFVELYGYGPYAARRNTGTHEVLYCRAFSFYDGQKRAMVIYSDLCTSDDLFARRMRMEIATRLRINPAGITFVATHTHSAPALNHGSAETSGICNTAFEEYWQKTVLRLAEEALLQEEEISSVQTGKAPLERPIGANRVDREKNVTDPAIRWMRFFRKDGSVKLLIHNHGVHGIADGGTLTRKVSSDWMGKANRLIREQSLADFALFFQGAAGDINTRESCRDASTESVGMNLASEYVRSLAADFENGKDVTVDKISFALETFEFPSVRQTAAELREEVKFFRPRGRNEKEIEYWEINACRLEEMALLVEKGYDLGNYRDLQVLHLGEAQFYFIPGEFFVEPGMKLLENASSPDSFIVTCANGAGRYYVSEEVALRYPSAKTEAKQLYGYYEIYGYMHGLAFKYQNNVSQFIIDSLLAMKVK